MQDHSAHVHVMAGKGTGSNKHDTRIYSFMAMHACRLAPAGLGARGGCVYVHAVAIALNARAGMAMAPNAHGPSALMSIRSGAFTIVLSDVHAA